MKRYGGIIGFITIFGFIIFAAAGCFMLDEMNSTLLFQQKEQFQKDAKLKIDIFNNRLNVLTNNFKSFSQLPSFRSIRFNELTLNKLVVQQNIRQLELFFFELIKESSYLLQIKYLDKDGNERFKVDKKNIYYDLSSISQYDHILHLDLKSSENHIELINDNAGKPKSLVWWQPIYVSSTKRLGYLAFEVDASLIIKELIDISDKGLNYVSITEYLSIAISNEVKFFSETIPLNIQQQNKEWLFSAPLHLSGLNWNINIIGNQKAHTKYFNNLRNTINFIIIPFSVIIVFILFFMFRRKEKSDRLIHNLAYYDSLTGLVNRYQFDNVLNMTLSNVNKNDVQHALLYMDLDQFKVVNDTCGHLAGDKLLEDLAICLRSSVRDSDILARLGGDEFALLLHSCPEEKVLLIANKILDAISDFKFFWQGKSFRVGVSIGVAFIDSPDETADNVLRKADLACYMAKELGRNRIHVFTYKDQDLESRHGEMEWVSRINHAISADKFLLFAQRVIALDENNSSDLRYEILLRLDENGDIISPGSFIPAAERYGIMPDIDRWVIDNTFKFIKELNDSNMAQEDMIFFSINISGLTLGDKNLLSFIREKLSKYKILPQSICFEITETATISNLSIAMNFIKNIKELGCSLSLDDFGSGLCSFSYLKTIPVDYLKIDGSFVTRMLDNPLDMAIIVAIKQISSTTGSKVIAEFVETAEVRDKLQELGIDYAQGYGIEKPIPISNLLKSAI